MDNTKPLAYRMSPQTLDDYAGQEHIIGKGKTLRRMIEADRLSSIILFGPPGVGKTALARVIANTTKSRFEQLNAVTAGVARRCNKSRGHSVTPALSPAIISTIDNRCINREYLCRRDLSSTLPETMFSSSSLAISPAIFMIPPIALKHDIIYLSDRSSSYIFSVTLSSLKAD